MKKVWAIVVICGAVAVVGVAGWNLMWSNTQNYTVTSTPNLEFVDDFTSPIAMDTTLSTQSDRRTLTVTNNGASEVTFTILCEETQTDSDLGDGCDISPSEVTLDCKRTDNGAGETPTACDGGLFYADEILDDSLYVDIEMGIMSCPQTVEIDCSLTPV